MTRTELREKLRQKFSSETWKDILPRLFPGTAFFQAPQEVIADGEVAKSIRQTGFLPLADDSRLGLFEVEIASEHTVIARNRVGLRALVAKLVDQAAIHGALVLFYRPSSQEYRLSFITKQSSFTVDGKLQTTETAPKRYTYVLGPEEPCTTATQRLGELLERDARPTLDSVTQAFSVARVTREFYKAIEQHHADLKEHLEKIKRIKGFEEPRIRAQFATRLLGRLVFLRFLAKKGIVPIALFDPENERDVTFYQKTLGALFFQTLNKPKEDRPANLPPEFSKVPYLNGGLFEPHDPHDGWPNPSFYIPPEWFKNLFETFQAYNFTVDENSLQDVEIAVDPEMLGQIFENLLATVNTETGQSARDAHGTFYTPREVVDYLCRQGVRLRLQNLFPEVKEDQWEALFAQSSGTALAEFSVDKGRLLDSLDKLKIFDPAVGSGAFPIGILHVLAELYEKLDDHFDAYKIKLRIIKNNLYGADIEPMAIELAKLRCWLSLMVESDRIKVLPLPNLDLKFFCLNTLFDPPPLDREDLFLRDGLIELYDLEQDFFGCNAKEKPARRLAIGKKLDELYQGVRSQYVRTALKKGTESKKRKSALDAASLYPENKTLFQDWLNQGTHALPFFPKELLCPDVFPLQSVTGGTVLNNLLLVNQIKGQQELVTKKQPPRSGFDVVVANPPYVRQEDIKELKPRLEHYECFKGTADLYVYFYERSVQLLTRGGSLAFITSNKYFRAGYGDKLRGFLAERHTLHQVIDFGDAPVFTAVAYPSIVLLTKEQPDSGEVKAMTWEPGSPVEDFARIFSAQSFFIQQNLFTAESWRIERPDVLALLKRLKEYGTPLGEYINRRLYRGILTGMNDAFVVDRETRDALIAKHPSSEVVLKPFLRGRDVKRWRTEFDAQFLIKIESSENATHPWTGEKDSEAWKTFGEIYPAIKCFMEGLEDIKLEEPDKRGCKNKFEQLKSRDDQGKYFWELRSCAYWKEFENPKIIIPAIEKDCAYAPELNGFYSNDKTSICVTSEIDFLLAQLNSSVLFWLIRKTAATKQGGFYEFKPMYVEALPIVSATEIQKRLVERIVSILISGGTTPLLESILNALIYELYFPEELHIANLRFFDLVDKTGLPEAGDAKAITAFTQVMTDPNHVLRRALFTLGSLPIVRLIESKQ
ncbi:MAG: N-6 DNA methylase [Methylacidiphilales bacterium]|nr:N-6 DNA methylase [Candidatus Methylacidiphilales bacterium]